MRYLLLLSCLFLFGCTTQKKAENWYRNHKSKLADLCLDCFGDKKEPEYIKGDTNIVKLDTIINIDSTNITTLDCPDGTKLGCPPPKVKTIQKHTHSVDTVYKDRWQTLAEIESLKGVVVDKSEEINIINEKLIKEKKSKEQWRYIALIALSLVGVYLLIKSLKNKLYGK